MKGKLDFSCQVFMNEEYVNEVIRRYNILVKERPEWGHYDLPYIFHLLNNYHDSFDETFNACFESKNWRELNNFLYQRTRLNIMPPFSAGDLSYQFLDALTAIAVGDYETMEYIFPANMGLRKHTVIYPLYRAGDILLAGLYYNDKNLLAAAIPKAEKYAAGKWPKWERATISYMLALNEHDLKNASTYLEDACKVMHTDFDQDLKKLFTPAHGLYRLAAKVLSEEEFKSLSMPNYKTFSKEYAKWCNSNTKPPELFIYFPEPVAFVNELLTADWNSIPYKDGDFIITRELAEHLVNINFKY